MNARNLTLALFVGSLGCGGGAEFVVTSSFGSGGGSLPAAVAAANSAPGADRITFDLTPAGGFTFVVLDQELLISSDLTIDGTTAAAPVVIDVGAEGDGVFRRALRVASGVEAGLNSLIIRGGRIDNAPGAIYPANGGGAILNAGRLVMDRCTLYDNQGGSFGGAITNNGGSLKLSQCTLSGNTAASQGGAVHNFHGDAEFIFCTVVLNSAAHGGGVYNEGACILDNSIVRGNTATAGGPDIHEFGGNTFTLNNANLFGSLAGTTRSPDGTFVIVSSSPVLPLDDQQGPWRLPVHPLGSVSAAVDAALGDDFPATDQRGRPRGVGGSPQPDLGAFERGRVVFVNPSASGNGSGNLWSNARTDLQAALSAAVGEDLIWIAGGIYQPDAAAGRASTFVLAPGVALFGGFPNSGTPLFSDRDVRQHETILSGDIGNTGDPSDNCHHVVTASGFEGASPPSGLDGLTITGGRADGAGTHDNRGGGLICRFGADLTVTGCTFRQNHARELGGAASVIDLPTTFRDCVFRENTSGNDGGALHHTYDQEDPATYPLTVTGCRFVRNSATGFGGALRLTRDEFTTASSQTSARVEGCRFLQNSAAQGGAIRIDKAVPELSDSIFRGNSAANLGGAVQASSQTRLIAQDCLFQGNVSGFDGGAAAVVTTGSTAGFFNCSFQGNRADRRGGALYLDGPLLNLRNNLIWNNSALGLSSIQSSSIGLPVDPQTTPHDPGSLPRNVLTAEDAYRNMVANWDPEELQPDSNLDNFLPQDPLFAISISPASAPSTGGDLRLLADSPFVGEGTLPFIDNPTDVLGAPRLTPSGSFSRINPGAHETTVPADYLSDHDGDGLPKALEQAFGTDPAAADPAHANRPRLFTSSTDVLFRISYVDREIPIRVTRSTDLVDFSELLFDGRSDRPGETVIDLRDFRLPGEPRAFYRVELVGP